MAFNFFSQYLAYSPSPSNYLFNTVPSNVPLNLQKSIERQWYGRPTWLWLLSPLSGIFWCASQVRKRQQLAEVAARRDKDSAKSVSCPLIVVGNITVGGTGKTPVIIALANTLAAAGLTPVIISRGYGAQVHQQDVADANTVKAASLPSEFDGVFAVSPTSSPALLGDEPVMIAKNTGCQVLISKDRVLAAKAAEQCCGATVILCDDGMQHYRLGRSFELLVLDGRRGLGNGWCLPVGPLRELPSRLKQVDWILINGQENGLLLSSQKASQKTAQKAAQKAQTIVTGQAHSYVQLQPVAWVNVQTGERQDLDKLFGSKGLYGNLVVNAVAGIGNPERFFKTLESLGVAYAPNVFPDHHAFTPQDFADLSRQSDGQAIIMTEKDAVKCTAFAEPHWWYLAVEFVLPKKVTGAIIEHCKNFDAEMAEK